MLPRNELGWTEDPKALVPGDPEQVWNTVRPLQGRARVLDDVGRGLKTIDTEDWRGQAAEAFRACFDHQPKRWFTASDAFDQAATALDSHAYTLQWAQGEAREAVALWKAGVAKTEAAAITNPNLLLHDDLINLMGDPWSRNIPGDPGAELRAQARNKLERARRQVDGSGRNAAAKVRAARDLAPSGPTLWERVAHFISPATAYGRYLSGIGTPIQVNANNYSWPELPLSKFDLKPENYLGKDGQYTVGAASSDIVTNTFSTRPTDFAGRATLGDVSFHLDGTLTVHGDSWEFIGSASAYDDKYDFNIEATHRSDIGQFSTIGGALVGEGVRENTFGLVTPQPYSVIIDGEIPIYETGTFK